MDISDQICFACNRPKHDHPIMIFKQGRSVWDAFSQDGVFVREHDDTLVNMFGKRWKLESVCDEFVGVKQLELF